MENREPEIVSERVSEECACEIERLEESDCLRWKLDDLGDS